VSLEIRRPLTAARASSQPAQAAFTKRFTDEKYLLINETGAGQIRRLWLKGALAGTSDVFVDGLPGAPDKLSFNGDDFFWVAFAGVLSPDLTALAGKLVVRRLLGALPPGALLPLEEAGLIVGIDTDGRVRYNL